MLKNLQDSTRVRKDLLKVERERVVAKGVLTGQSQIGIAVLKRRSAGVLYFSMQEGACLSACRGAAITIVFS